jgi:hypothetical protein
MSKGNGKNNSNGNSNSFLISKNQTSRFSAKSRASLTRTLYVSLDNADKVIEGGPFKPFFALSGAVLGVKGTHLVAKDATRMGHPRDGLRRNNGD